MVTPNISGIPEKTLVAVNKKLEIWKERLQDLSGRNRLLFFKPAKSYTLEITTPDIYDIYQKIVVDGRGMEFPVIDEDSSEDEVEADSYENLLPHQIGVKQSPKRMNLNLYNLRSRSKTAREEQGIVVLYLALGFLKWKESASSEFSKAPLVMVPVIIDREGFGQPYKLKIVEEDIVLNLSLDVKLRNDFKLCLPEISEFNNSTDLKNYFREVEQKVSSFHEWSVLKEAVISVFNFQNLTIITDLEKQEKFFIKNPLIQGLSLGHMLVNFQGDLIEESQLDDMVSPSEVFQILDADSSQQKAIEAAKAGLSMIIQGPPGTGKSQTIANIIAEFLATQKNVLFVSQKMAALKVVHNRLEQLGLGEFCLEVHSHRRNKKEIIDELGAALNRKSVKISEKINWLLKDIQTSRTRLNEYVRTLHLPQLDFEISAFKVYGVLAKLANTFELRFDYSDVENISEPEYYDLLGLLGELTSFNEIINNFDTFPWSGATHKEFTIQDKERLEDTLHSLYNIIHHLNQFSTKLANHYKLLPPETLSGIGQLLRLTRNFTPSIFSLSLEDIYSRYQVNYKNICRYLKRKYWEDRKLIQRHARGDKLPSVADVTNDLEYAVFLSNNLRNDNVEHEEPESEVISKLEDHSEKARKVASIYKEFIRDFNLDKSQSYIKDFFETPLNDLLNALENLQVNTHLLSAWIEFRNLREEAQSAGLGDFIDKAQEELVPAEVWVDVFNRRFFILVLDAILRKNKVLSSFSGHSHEGLIKKFRELDKKHISLAIQQIRANLLISPTDSTWMKAGSSEERLLKREMNKKRRIKPLRRLFKEIPSLLIDLKPCLMMSPFTVSQLLDPELFQFDLVIFDEASQIPPEYAVGAFARGKQVVVAGDSKQLPPTRFFQTLETESDYEDDIYDEFESILNECNAIGMPDNLLNWHYRSRDESLIAFSNFNFYNNRLYTFPSSSHDKKAIQFLHVPDGIYKRGVGGRFNIVEAREVVKGIINHYQTNPRYSLGVVTFNYSQKVAIEKQLEKTLKDWPSLNPLLKDEGKEPFFVKNLEMVQGDERDFIIFSVCFGFDGAGKFSQNFGPLSNKGGERRLNVAITRARHGVKIYSSIQPEDINIAQIKNQGPKLLKNYLEFARDGYSAIFSGMEINIDADFDSPFEQAVYDALTERGLKLQKQVGVSGYRLDLAVFDQDQPGRFLLGIECDGAMYHSAATARDRDRLRQSVLENLGWVIHRIWSREWFSNQQGEIKKVLDIVEKVKRGEVGRKISEQLSSNDIDEDMLIFDETEKSESVIFGEIQRPQGTAFYKKAILPKKGYSATHFHNALQSIKNSVLKQVVDQEGPISIRVAKQRVASAWNIKRIGIKIDRVLDNTVKKGILSGQVIERDGFLWSTLGWNKIPRIPNLVEKQRSINDIPLEEIVEIAYVCMKAARSLTPDDLIRETARLFRLRVTDNVQERIIKAARKLEGEKRIHWRGNKIRLPK